MMVYYPEEGTVLPHFFGSYDGATGASEAISGLAVGDIKIYKGVSMTERSSTAGFTLLDTDGIDVDSLVGINGFSIDLNDNTDAGFYTVGSWYNVIIASITADGQTVNFPAFAFRIVSAVRGLAGTALPNVASGSAGAIPTTGTGANQISVTSGLVTLAAATHTGAVIPTVSTLTGHTPQTGDTYARIGANGVSLSAVPWNAAWDAEVQSEVNDALVAYSAATAANVTTAITTITAAIDDLADADTLTTGFAQSGSGTTTLVLQSEHADTDIDYTGYSVLLTYDDLPDLTALAVVTAQAGATLTVEKAGGGALPRAIDTDTGYVLAPAAYTYLLQIKASLATLEATVNAPVTLEDGQLDDVLTAVAATPAAVWAATIALTPPTDGDTTPNAGELLVLNTAKIGGWTLTRSGTTLTATLPGGATIVWTLAPSADAATSVDRTG